MAVKILKSEAARQQWSEILDTAHAGVCRSIWPIRVLAYPTKNSIAAWSPRVWWISECEH
jgi:hypothetical protein